MKNRKQIDECVRVCVCVCSLRFVLNIIKTDGIETREKNNRNDNNGVTVTTKAKVEVRDEDMKVVMEVFGSLWNTNHIFE